LGRHRERLAEAERVELAEGALLPRGLDLVRGEDDRSVGAPEHACDLEIERGCAGSRVHHEQDEVRLLDRDEHLLAHGLDERLLGGGSKPPLAIPLPRQPPELPRPVHPTPRTPRTAPPDPPPRPTHPFESGDLPPRRPPA